MPAEDDVQVPPPAAYFEPFNWHRTALHELGHAERRARSSLGWKNCYDLASNAEGCMGLGNFDPFDPFDPGWLQAYAAMQEQVEPAGQEEIEAAGQEQVGQIGDEDFEQHLAQEQQAGAVSDARGPARSDYRHLSDDDRALITSAFAAKVACGDLKEVTRYSYAVVLRRLGNRLGERGQTLGALDHESLLAHAKELFPSDRRLVPALRILQRYREGDQVGHEDFERHLAEGRQGNAPSVAAAPTRSDSHYRYLSVGDQHLINATFDAAVDRGDLNEGTKYVYALALRKLGNYLGERGQTIDALDHDTLLAHAKELFPSGRRVVPALNALQGYRVVDRVGHHEVERRLFEWRQAGAASVTGIPAPSGPRYRYLSDGDQNLINSTLEAAVTRGDLTEATRCHYASALRGFGIHLGERGQTIEALDHDSLVAHAKEFLPLEGRILPALKILQMYREPGISDGKRRRFDFCVEDAPLIDRALQTAAARWRWARGTTRNYEGALRSLAESLGPGRTITSLDHDSLVAHANRSFPDSRTMKAALRALHEYRVSKPLADRRPPHYHGSSVDGGDVIDDVTSSNQRTEATFPTAVTAANTMRVSCNSSLMAGAPGAASALQMGEQAAHSSLQDVDPDKNWQEADQAGQWQADSWDTSNFWEDLPSPVGLPQQSSSPPASIPAWPPPNELGHVLPLQFNHGPQGAPDVLIAALNRTGLLPGPYLPSINLSLHGLPYTATLGKGLREATPNNPHGDDIILKPRFLGG